MIICSENSPLELDAAWPHSTRLLGRQAQASYGVNLFFVLSVVKNCGCQAVIALFGCA